MFKKIILALLILTTFSSAFGNSLSMTSMYFSMLDIKTNTATIPNEHCNMNMSSTSDLSSQIINMDSNTDMPSNMDMSDCMDCFSCIHIIGNILNTEQLISTKNLPILNNSINQSPIKKTSSVFRPPILFT